MTRQIVIEQAAEQDLYEAARDLRDQSVARARRFDMGAWAPGACETGTSHATCIHAADERDEALEVALLVVVKRQVAAMRTVDFGRVCSSPEIEVEHCRISPAVSRGLS